jgi:hypothetical protein
MTHSTTIAVLLLASSTPAQPPAIPLDKDRALFDRIEDGAPVRSEAQNPDEFRAYNAVLTHARQFAVAELEAAARRDVTFRDLFNPTRQQFKLDLVYFSGRLKRLRDIGATRPLKEAGVNELYEAWLFPPDQPNPICVLITELPAGIVSQRDLAKDKMDVPVGVAGYSFKLMTYEAAEPNATDPTRGRLRQAPLLMGRSFTVLPEPGRNPSDDWYGTFLPVLIVGLLGVAGVVGGLSWWYRRQDRAVARVRDGGVNPFAGES